MIWVKSPGLLPPHPSSIYLGKNFEYKTCMGLWAQEKADRGKSWRHCICRSVLLLSLKLSLWYLHFWRKVKNFREIYEIWHSQTSANNFMGRLLIRVCNDICPPPICWEFQILHFWPQLCSQGAGPRSHLMVHNISDAICLQSNIGQAPEHGLLSLHFPYGWIALHSSHHPVQRLGILLGAFLSLSPCTCLIIKSCSATSNPWQEKICYRLFISTYINKVSLKCP